MLTWFKEHLNWAYFTAFVFYYFACFMAGLILGATTNGESEVGTDGVAYLISAILFLIIMLPTSIWVIRAKGRSLWWLLLAGWFSPLWLTSKKKQEVINDRVNR